MAWTWLEKIGHDIVSVFQKAEPIIEEVQKLATPFENLYAPGLSQVINLTIAQIANAEALGTAAANSTGGNGGVKLAAVTSAIAPQIAPILAGMGVKDISSTQYANFISALVTAMNTFVTTSGPAAAPNTVAAPITGATVVGK